MREQLPVLTTPCRESRGLLAIAILGFVLIGVFNRNLDRRLDALAVAPEVRQTIDAQRSKLAAVQTTNSKARKAVAESFIAGYRSVLWIAVALSVASSVSAALLIDFKGKPGSATAG
jgi:hypothetical protein